VGKQLPPHLALVFLLQYEDTMCIFSRRWGNKISSLKQRVTLIRCQFYLCLDFGLLSLQTYGKYISILYKLPTFRHFVIAAERD
jgi:hypothetical protein